MGLLSRKEIASLAIRTGHVYEYVCDTPGCGKLIRPCGLMVVLQWAKRTDGLQTLLGMIPAKIRCMDCEEVLHPKKEVVKIHNAGRGVGAVSTEIASEIQIDVRLRRLVLKLLKATPEGVPVANFLPRLHKTKMVREMSKKVFKATIKGMKKLKMFRRSKGKILLPKQKKVRKKKEKVLQ